MVEEKPHVVRFEIQFDVYGDAPPALKETRAAEVMERLLGKGSGHVMVGKDGRSTYVPTSPHDVAVYIREPTIIKSTPTDA